MKPRLFLLLKLLFCLLLLALFQEVLVAGYRLLLEVIGSLLSVAKIEDFACGEACSLRLIVYLSFVIVTPKINWARRALMLVIGLSVFVAIDLAGIYLWPASLPLEPVGEETFVQFVYGLVWNLFRDLLLPLLLWVVICDRHLGLFFPDADIAAELRDDDRFSEG
ncbi:hypothetical protein SAMN02745165_02308 [Malonomonas rubra DSM 5091]|uniref:Uncharacterized protein n=1 Tax=Malonomonas rubra DSM 5091 TaxID=1122189 RepID=A0A1M6J5E6_MALRU|nr:hypothetical protein [Malonomonas rubra]SHJ41920.1 hypothetical protein SAMN02745165_02308 [Malonomonas rubra DSM 5091]